MTRLLRFAGVRVVLRNSVGIYHALATGIFAVALSGCGRSGIPERLQVYPVEGKIDLNGKVPAGATVILHPKDESHGQAARAQVKPDGTFSASTYATADGAAEGDYVVTVEWRKTVEKNGDYSVGPNLVPEKYSNRQTSQIEVHVAAQANVLPPIKLTR